MTRTDEDTEEMIGIIEAAANPDLSMGISMSRQVTGSSTF